MRDSRPAWIGLALALALGVAARADFPESFKQGIREMDFGEWRAAELAMRQAVAQQPLATGENVRVYNTRVEPYLPQYFLGIALFEQGDYAGASKAFGEAAAQGTVRGLKRGRLEFFQEVCARHLGTTPAPSTNMASVNSGSGGNPVRRRVPGPGVPPSLPGPTAITVNHPAPPGPPQSPEKVREEALDRAAQEGRQAIQRGEGLVRRLQAKRAAEPRRFDRNQVEILAVADDRLQAAKFLLEGCRREGDLEGIERAREDAEAASEILQELAKDL